MGDLEGTLKSLDLTSIDFVTFSGTGEPTLNLKLGEIAELVKSRIKGIPMAILTNSSLFYRDDVRRNLRSFDLVVAKFDAGDDETLRLINRPADHKLTVDKIIESIRRLRSEVSGMIALEVMLLETEDGRVSNVDGRSLSNLIDGILTIKPDIVQLEVPYRPPSEKSVRVPSSEKIDSIAKILSEELGEERIWVYGRHDRRGKPVRWLRHERLEDMVLNLLERRPCRPIDISISLGISPADVETILRKFMEENLISSAKIGDETFYMRRIKP